MKPMQARRSLTEALLFSAQLHDATAELALGIGFLKSGQLRALNSPDQNDPLELLGQALAKLKVLEATPARRSDEKRRPDLVTSLRLQAHALGVELDLRVAGSTWLAPNVAELLCLAGREALANVRRHSGVRACRIELDFTSCPFAFRARDWGAGVRTGVNGGHGLSLLNGLADQLGCEFVVASQPGLGTELLINGPRCVRSPKQIFDRTVAQADTSS
jgi:signal transduction histidine kinase